jgi:hypothetical protein
MTNRSFISALFVLALATPAASLAQTPGRTGGAFDPNAGNPAKALGADAALEAKLRATLAEAKLPRIATTVFGTTQNIFYADTTGNVRHLVWDGRWKLGGKINDGVASAPEGSLFAITRRRRRAIEQFKDLVIEPDRLELISQSGPRRAESPYYFRNEWKRNAPPGLGGGYWPARPNETDTASGFGLLRGKDDDWLVYQIGGTIRRLRFPTLYGSEAFGVVSFENMTESAGNAPLAQGRPTAYMLGTSEHVVYRGKDDRVYELYTKSRAWVDKWSDLVAEARAPSLAAGDPVGVVFGNTQQIYYQGKDGHIHNLWWDGAWHHTDVTRAANANLNVAVASRLSVHTLGNSQHVVFVGGDGHVHELYWSYGGAWKHTDISASARSTAVPRGAPSSYTFGLSQHVAFVGSNGHVYDLYWDGSWHETDATVAALK